jgi:drug/metabolite transporter (DMT)-like permease
MLLIYRPAMDFPWYYHAAGLASGITAALAYLAVNKLSTYYDPRVIVLSFIGTGVLVPVLFMVAGKLSGMPADDVFFISWRWPVGGEWTAVLLLGLSALFGQYFVTRAYTADAAGLVSAISYSNIVFSVFIGMALGDAFPDIVSLGGILCIVLSGVIISGVKARGRGEKRGS